MFARSRSYFVDERSGGDVDDGGARGRVELIKSASWQALVRLFTPVATLLAMVTLAQTKYKDAMTHCLSAELVHKPVSRR